MSNILQFEGFDSVEIRVTPDGRYSVYDVIEFCGKKNPHQTWSGDKRENGLIKQFPEVVQKVENFQFPGQGQRPTPVADKEATLYIIGLLPGAIGKAYREAAAKALIQHLDGDKKLELEQWNTIRIKGKDTRRTLTDAIKEYISRHPELSENEKKFMYSNATDALYLNTHHARARKLVSMIGCDKQKLRDSLSKAELAVIEAIEQIAIRLIDRRDMNPVEAVKEAVYRSEADGLFVDVPVIDGERITSKRWLKPSNP